ncbi:hypothetical protein BD410DRAFT_808295 [Rickenella mellea]|uniref:Uncharacterized protein n=1 Tax=Rickenella mellea TaxID=50990 RepID=A0A4Y7PLR3_9AGAM|nr:hypothetical protein BD410DRAFT_808295 [Rickenella mellea]
MTPIGGSGGGRRRRDEGAKAAHGKAGIQAGLDNLNQQQQTIAPQPNNTPAPPCTAIGAISYYNQRIRSCREGLRYRRWRSRCRTYGGGNTECWVWCVKVEPFESGWCLKRRRWREGTHGRRNADDRSRGSSIDNSNSDNGGHGRSGGGRDDSGLCKGGCTWRRRRHARTRTQTSCT